MEALQVIHEKSIPNAYGSTYDGIAFDGCYFYLTCSNQYEIIKYDKNLCKIECFKTCKPYTCLCYDYTNQCFWAATTQYCHKLFKLDSCFREIDCINIHPCESCGTHIIGVSYDCSKNCLLVSFANCIICIDVADCNYYKLLQHSCNLYNTAVLSISPNYAVIQMNDSEQFITFYDENAHIKCSIPIPKGCIAQSIIFNPCSHSKELHFYLLTTKNDCYSYLIEWTLPPFYLEIDDCNYCICKQNCSDSPCHKQACNDAIESVALMQTALSHILNAEGEKLQKVIASTDDIDKILCANKAINQTLVSATHLEIILHDKLAMIQSLCCDCNKDCSDCDACNHADNDLCDS